MTKASTAGICKRCGKHMEWTLQTIEREYLGYPCKSRPRYQLAKIHREIEMDAKYCSDCKANLRQQRIRKVLSIPRSLYRCLKPASK